MTVAFPGGRIWSRIGAGVCSIGVLFREMRMARPMRGLPGPARGSNKPANKGAAMPGDDFQVACQMACKPGSVSQGRSLRSMAIHLGRPSPGASRDLPGPGAETRPPFGMGPYLILLPVGFALPPPLPAARCALTAPFHPYPACPKTGPGGLLSVALSLGSPPPGVTRHRVSVEPGLSSPRCRQGAPEGDHPPVWPLIGRPAARRRQPAIARSASRRRAVSESIRPSTRLGRKCRWKAATTRRAGSSSRPVAWIS